MKIAIDGPAGAGKSTISKAIAKDLGYIYIDTGAMYRAAGLAALENGVNIKEHPVCASELVETLSIEIKPNPDGQLIFLNNRNVTNLIRTEAVSMAASDISAIKEVRIKLVNIQRKLAEGNNVIMDGRDIGTHVLPDAECKIFLTASSRARGERRYNELCEKGISCSLEDICSDIEKRDKNDSERKESPLKKADDAIMVDTTDLSLDESIQKIKTIINKKITEVKEK